ncbi:MAG: toxin-antitoxin system TumE family protein [bacterium]
MLNVHAAAIEAAIRSRAVVATYALNTVQLSPNTGYVEGEIMFVNGSRLVFFEFWRRRAAGLNREKYRYHLMNANSQLLFRYDDALHHPGVATFPHHKHLPIDVTHSPAPHFAEVLAEAEAQVLGIP